LGIIGPTMPMAGSAASSARSWSSQPSVTTVVLGNSAIASPRAAARPRRQAAWKPVTAGSLTSSTRTAAASATPAR
jgi:hypothetical protein